MRILVNYNYNSSECAFAQAVENALKQDPFFEVFRIGENRLPCVDFILNLDPCCFMAHYPHIPSAFWKFNYKYGYLGESKDYSKVDYLFLANPKFHKMFHHKNRFFLPVGDTGSLIRAGHSFRDRINFILETAGFNL